MKDQEVISAPAGIRPLPDEKELERALTKYDTPPSMSYTRN
jgi:hypothetical protein